MSTLGHSKILSYCVVWKSFSQILYGNFHSCPLRESTLHAHFMQLAMTLKISKNKGRLFL